MATPGPTTDLLALPRPALAALLDRIGVGAHHADRVFGGLHRRGLDPGSVRGLGPHRSAALLAAAGPPAVRLAEAHPSPGGTEKLVFALADGARVEGVLIPTGPRDTFCVSSQVGCAMACGFCATARLGLTRGLTPGEIVGQVYLAMDRAAAAGRRVRNVVFMGMGEPLHHYESTRDAVAILCDPHGRSFAWPKITVSTVGLAPQIGRLGRELGGRVQLAVSLNAGTEATRRALMPIAHRYDLQALREAVTAYPLPRNRFILIEYVLLAGITDTPAELEGLARWTNGLRCMVNLIPFNVFPGAGFRSPEPAAVDAAVGFLRASGVAVSVRLPKGRPASAACGQLALEAGEMEASA